MRTTCKLLLPCVAAVSFTLLPSAAIAGVDTRTCLTEPRDGAPLEIAVDYLEGHAEELGLTFGDLADFTVADQYQSRHNGVTHIYLQQRLGGVEVVNGLINVNVLDDGRILNLGNKFVGDLAGKANAKSPSLEPGAAVFVAAEHLGLKLAVAPAVLEVVGGPSMEVRFDSAGISRNDIGARLNYLKLADGAAARLVWTVSIADVRNSDWWSIFVDTETGAVLDKFNATVNDGAKARFEAPRKASPRPAAKSDETGGGCTECYNVFATPKESPDDGPRTFEIDPADPTASPFGWHDTDGSDGAEFTDTRGNNVAAQTDIDANNTFGPPDVRSEGGANLQFDDPLDLADQPADYMEFAVSNLFYWNNIMHDITYRYGFDEASGNFQVNNYGGGGLGNDPVQADAQDGSGTNNANFLTNPDGNSNIRMQMFIWIDGGPTENGRVTINSPPVIAGDYVAGQGAWGGTLDPVTTADLEIVDDGSGAPSEGCGPLIGFTPGNIALIDRGNCEFGTKSLNAENAGASGAIIVNNQQLPNGIITMGAGVDGGSVTIPAVMIGSADGTTIRNEIPTVNGTLQCPIGGCPVANPINRDSDLDAGVIAHEYGHGISNRLTGGPGTVSCLNHDEQAGEGWSDWWTLSLFPLPSDTSTTTRGVGNYVTFQPVDASGIRNFPYTTDITVNPQTYADIGDTNIPHGVGEIWAEMLWEMYWNLVDKHGFNPDLYADWTTGGNNLAMQLVIDGMKLQPCSPTFVEARDGILDADVALTGGANDDEIWCAFAKRGVGLSASAGGTGVGDEIEAFDLPAGVTCPLPGQIFADGFESGDTTAWSTTVP